VEASVSLRVATWLSCKTRPPCPLERSWAPMLKSFRIEHRERQPLFYFIGHGAIQRCASQLGSRRHDLRRRVPEARGYKIAGAPGGIVKEKRPLKINGQSEPTEKR
jgi:hypothetical protein